MTIIEKLEAICEAEQKGEAAKAARIEISLLETWGQAPQIVSFGNFASAEIYKNKAGKILVLWSGSEGGAWSAVGKFESLEAAAEKASTSYASAYIAAGMKKRIIAA